MKGMLSARVCAVKEGDDNSSRKVDLPESRLVAAEAFVGCWQRFERQENCAGD